MKLTKFKPYIEMFLLIIIIYFMEHWLKSDSPILKILRPGPYLVIIILGAVKYGSPVGLILGVICSLVHLSEMNLGGNDSLRDALILNAENLLPLVLYIGCGHFIGESVHSRLKVKEYFSGLATERKKLADTLAGEKAELENRYRALESKIAVDSRSSSSYIRDLIEFDNIDYDRIGERTVLLTAKYLNAQGVAYWSKINGSWKRTAVSVEIKDSETVPPQLLLKADEIQGMACARDYPEIASLDKIDMAFCIASVKTTEAHALTCNRIPLKEWNSKFENMVRNILREAMAASDFWNVKYQLDQTTSMEERLRLDNIKTFRSKVRSQLLTLQRSSSISSMVFICVERVMSDDIRVLGVIASAFRSLLRISDVLSFMPNESYFVLFLPQTGLEGAQVVMDKINSNIDRLGLKPHQRQIILQSAYYELKTAGMLDSAFETFRKDLLV